MRVTIDLRHAAVCAVFLAAGAALHAFAAVPPPSYSQPPPPPPSDPSYGVSPPAPAVTRWDFRCVDDETANVSQNWANHDLDKPEGWNPYLARMAAQGWEPTTFIAPNAIIKAVCFRRPAVVRPPQPSYPPVPPATPMGRCSAAQIQDMRAQGMSESAINAACRQP